MKTNGKSGELEKLLTSDEVADHLQVKSHTLLRWRLNGKGPVYLKFGKGQKSQVRYRLSDILAYEQQMARTPKKN